jgi:hypothetical protein
LINNSAPHKSHTKKHVLIFPLVAILKLALGIVCGLGLFEITLHLNPTLLPRGMAVDAPVEPPITTSFYDVHYSEADTFYWPKNRIQPIEPQRDGLEAHVRFETDEFGFPNAAPLPSSVDVIILGRSYSVGAQTSNPWPRLLATYTKFKVLNLAQPGSTIDVKLSVLQRYGFPRKPAWIIVEILPSKDLLDYQASTDLLIQRLPLPILQSLLRQIYPASTASTDLTPLYPIQAKVNERTIDLTFFPPDLQALTANAEMLADSVDWRQFREEMLTLFKEARTNRACIALLYTPTKPEIYIDFLDNETLLHIAEDLEAWHLNSDKKFVASPTKTHDIQAMRSSSEGIRAFLGRFAQESGVYFIDPIESLQNAVHRGLEPYMVYDTHWSTVGHDLVAQEVAKVLQNADCH